MKFELVLLHFIWDAGIEHFIELARIKLSN